MQISDRFEVKKHGGFYKFFNKLMKNAYILIAPAMITCLALTIFPMCFAVYLGFHKWDPISGRKKLVWFDNFRYLFQSEDFIKVIGNTLLFMFFIVFVGLLIKLLIGIFLNKRTPLHNFTQTVIFTPHIVASVSVAIIFMGMMAPKSGLFNTILSAFGLPTSNWYLGADSAMASVIMVSIWQSTGYGVLLIIAGLRGIPDYIYEAARLDRSKPINTFFKITIPLLSPTLLYLLITTVCSAFTSFDVIKMMTDGGPDNATNLIAYYVYQQGMMFNQYGRAMAAAVILLIFTATLSAINFFALDRKVYYQ